MKQLIKAIGMVLLLASSAVAEDARENLAVMDLTAINASQSDAVAVSGFLRSAAVRADAWNVVDKGNMERVLAEQAFQQTGCTDASCAVKVGKLLNVKKIIVGEYTILEGNKFMNVSLVDVETGRIERTATEKGFNILGADTAADSVIRQLKGSPATAAKPSEKTGASTAKPAVDWSRVLGGFSGELGIGAQNATRDHENAKFREYWYDMKSPLALLSNGSLNYQQADSSLYAGVGYGGRSGLEGPSTDGEAHAEVGSYGLFKLKGDYIRIGHVFAFNARTLYDGAGTNKLTLDDDIQETLQFPYNTTMDTKGTKASTTVIVDPLNNFLNDATKANIEDIMLRRDRVSARLEGAPLLPLSGILGYERAGALVLGVNMAGEWRSGTKPYMANFGMANSVEIPEPVEYTTMDIGADVGYNDTLAFNLPVTFELGFGRSTFKNDFHSLEYDNLFRKSDAWSTSGYSETYRAGATTGRVALPPDNTADSVYGSLAFGLPMHSRIAGSASYSVMKQDDKLLPHTTNTALTPLTCTYFDDTLPVDSAGAEVVKKKLDLSFSASPVRRYHMTLRGKYEQHDNRTESVLFPSTVRTDVAPEPEMETEYVSWIRRTAEFEQSFDVGGRSTIALTLEHENAAFSNGSAKSEDQNIVRLSFDTRAVSWATLRVSGEHGARVTDYPDYEFSAPEIPTMRKYYAADRDADKLHAMATFNVSPELAVILDHQTLAHNYPHSAYGLQNSRSNISTVSMTYTPDEMLSFDVFYSLDTYSSLQKSRQWTMSPTGVPKQFITNFGTESNGDWTVEGTNVVNTVGFATNMYLVPDALVFRLDGTFSQSNGKEDFDSPLGLSATYFEAADTNPWPMEDFRSADETKSIQAGATLRYDVGAQMPALKGLALILGYQYNLWKYHDDLLDGYTDVATSRDITTTAPYSPTYNAITSMNTMYSDFEVHTVFMKANYSF